MENLYLSVSPPLTYPGNLVSEPFEFAQRVSLGASNILTPRFPWPTTLTNHMGVSDIGGPKALLCLLVGSAGLDMSPLVFF